LKDTRLDRQAGPWRAALAVDSGSRAARRAGLTGEQERRDQALATLDRIATGEDDGFDSAVSAALHRQRR
jgi:hypothetical protein